MDSEARSDIEELVSSGIFSVWKGGPWSRQFEEKFATYHGARLAVAVNSGTSALHCAYAAMDLKPIDEVIISASCYVSAASAAAQMGARIVVCDVDPETLSIDLDALKQCISANTRLIVPVHMWGIPSRMQEIDRIATEHGVRVIEDCAQAHGALIDNRYVGTFGAVAAFSFSPEKVISTGQGGMVLCASAEIAERVRRLVNKGKGDGWHEYVELGYSYVLPEFESILGLCGLRYLPSAIRRRQRVANIYQEAFDGEDIKVVLASAGVVASYYKCAIRIPAQLRGRRDELLNAIAAENVGARLTHPPLASIAWLRPYLGSGQERLQQEGRLCPVAKELLPLVIELETDLDEEEAWRSAAGVLRSLRAVAAKPPLKCV